MVDKTVVFSGFSCEDVWLVSVLFVSVAKVSAGSADDDDINTAVEVVIGGVVVAVAVVFDGVVVNGLVVGGGCDLVAFVVGGVAVAFVVDFVVNSIFVVVVVDDVIFVVVVWCAVVVWCVVVVSCAVVVVGCVDGCIDVGGCVDGSVGFAVVVSKLLSIFNIHIILHCKPLQVDNVLNHSIHNFRCHNF